MQLKYNKTVSYIGRNGFGKQTGIEIQSNQAANPIQVVTLSPINSKGNVARCMIDLPVDSIPAFVKELKRIYKLANAPKK